jgi:hypothetical protein
LKTFLYNIFLFYLYSFRKVKIYHSGQVKSKWLILSELLKWMIREGDFNKMYYAFGLNIKGSNVNEFIGRKSFLSLKDKTERNLKKKAGSSALNYDVVTKDKFVANSFLKANGIPCTQNIALIHDSIMIFPDGKQEMIDAVFNLKERFIIKNTVLEAGDGVFVCNIENNRIRVNNQFCSLEEFRDKLGTQVWVVQNLYHSHNAIKRINESALNTTRIVTILNGKGPEFLSGFQSFATNNATTDSWSKGSVYVGIDIEKCCLEEFGYYNIDRKENSRVSEHPDSRIVFKGYTIPFLKEAVNLCLTAHKLFYFNFVIGWDVAITEEGPVIVEANERPGMNAVQCIDGGLRYTIWQHANKYLKSKKT